MKQHHRGRWNEMNEMRVEKWWNEICSRGKRETTRKIYQDSDSSTTKPTWRSRESNSGPQRWGGRRTSNRLRHGAAITIHNSIKCNEVSRITIIGYRCYHQNVLPKGRSFTANSRTNIAVLSKGRSSTVKSGSKVAVLLWINRCGSFPLLSAPHSFLASKRTLWCVGFDPRSCQFSWLRFFLNCRTNIKKT